MSVRADDEASEARLDAWHDGYLQTSPRPSEPTLAAEWDAGRLDAQRDRRRARVTMPAHPEGYYHSRLTGEA